LSYGQDDIGKMSSLRVAIFLVLVAGLLGQPLWADPLSKPDNVDLNTNFGGSDPVKDPLGDMGLGFDDKRDRRRVPDRAVKSGLGPVNSNNTPDRNEPFDGSEFKLSPFTEENFTKPAFSELFQPPVTRNSDHPFDKKIDFTDGDTDKRDLADIDLAKKKRAEKDKLEFTDLIRPLYFLPGDWNPSSLDPVWNGGFSTPPDNGSPVPYRLDGHVDLQRPLPWGYGD